MDLSLFNQRPSADAFVQHWLDTVCSHDPQAITDLYLSDGVLLGTVAENIKYGQSQIRSYFDMFVEKKPCGVIMEITSANYHGISVVNGNYVFEINGRWGYNSSPCSLHLRFEANWQRMEN